MEKARAVREPIRVAVVGVGSMGRNHARIYSSLKAVELVAVVDADLEVAEESARLYGCDAAAKIAEVEDRIDAASVAVPSSAHAEIACSLLAKGIHCLVEKPLALSEKDCLSMIKAAKNSNAVLAVGHTERFNPAVLQLNKILASSETAVAVEAHRLDAVSRIVDVDVVADLMIHDIDIALDLLQGELIDIVARGVRSPDQRGFDHATALLTFSTGAIASVTASRITQNQVRSLHVTTRRRFFSLDYLQQQLSIWTRGSLGNLDDDPYDLSQHRFESRTERVLVRRTEPLLVEILNFITSVRGDAVPAVSAEQALASLRVVWSIQQSLEAGTIKSHQFKEQ